MTQIFRVELAGVDITDNASKVSISKTINRFYNVATVEISKEDIVSTILGKVVTVFYGDETFEGIAFESSKTSHDTFNVTLRTFGAKLSEPFSAVESVIEDANTAIELCALYSSVIGLNIDYQTVDLDFGGSYAREGTMLTALTAICNTIGAEYFDNGTEIVIQGSKTIGDTYDHELRDDQYMDFLEYGNSLYNAGVSEVRTSTGAVSTGDIIEANKINMEVYEDGSAHIYCIPKGVIENSYGIDVKDPILTKDISESTTLINETVIFLKTSIESVKYVKLNGIEVTSYQYVDGNSALYFTVPQTGFIEISYVGYYQDSLPIYTDTPNGSLAVVELYYLNQVLKHYWYMDSLVSGGVRVYIEKDATIWRGFKAYMLDGGIPKARLYANGVLFNTIDTSIAGTYVSTSEVSLSPTTDPEYEYRLPADQTVLLVTSFGLTVTPVETTVLDEKVLTFDRYYPQVNVTVSEPARIIEVPSTFIDGEILLTMEDMNTNVITEHDIQNVDANDINSIPCILDQNVPVDIAQQTGLDLQEVIGKYVVVTDPQGQPTSHQVRADGLIKIWVYTNGEYTIDTRNITGRFESYIILTAQV